MKELYEKYKGLLFTLAYQLTGSVADSEDVVQDVFMKIAIQHPDLQQPKAYLCKMATNLSLDRLKSARKKRERYIGPWLPEPVATPDPDSFEAVVRNDLLSYAILVMLERLSPAERAVFVLREAFRFEYSEIAKLLDKSEVNCRKLLSRARRKMGISEEEMISPEPAEEEWIRKFIFALEQGNVEAVLSMLAEDVVLVSDGGGKATAAVYPIEKRSPVARFLLGLAQKAPQYGGGVHIELSPLNGQTAMVIRTKSGVLAVALLHVEHGAVKNLYFVRNPDKLARIQ